MAHETLLIMQFLSRYALVAILLTSGLTLHSAPKIGVLLKGKTEFWSAMEKGVSEAGDKLGAEIILKSPTAESDIAIQIQLLNSLVAQGVTALVVAPSSADALIEPIAAAAAKGIKIVILDSPLNSKNPYVFVGTDQKAAGKAAGKLLSSLVQEPDEVAFFKHSQGSAAATQREIGALEAFRELHPKMTVHGDIYASTEKNIEKERAELLLTKYPSVKAIFASATPGTLAMFKALKEKNLGGSIKFVGVGFNLRADISEGIDSGVISGWVAQIPQDMGYKGVETALKILKDDTVPSVINIDFLVVTKSNLHDPKIQAFLHN